MQKHDPGYLKPLLIILALVAGAGFYYAYTTPGHHKIYLRSLCLLIAVGPAGVLSIFCKRAMWLLRLSIAGALMFFMYRSGSIDFAAMRGGLSSWPWLLAGIFLVFLQAPVGALRWKWLLSVQDIHLGFFQTLRLTFVGFFFNICLPGATGGDLFKAFAITRKEKKTAEAITTIFLDRITGLGGLLLLATLALLANRDFISYTPSMKKIAWTVLIILIGGIVFISLLMSRRLAGRLRKSFIGKINFPGRAGFSTAYRALHAYHGSREVLFRAVAISLASHLCTISAALCFAHALKIEGLSFAQYLLLVPLGLAFNAVPVTPGGIGQGQMGFKYLFEKALPGVAGAGALGAAMMTFIHVSILLIGITGAIFYALGYHKLHQAFEQAEEQGEAELDLLPEEFA